MLSASAVATSIAALAPVGLVVAEVMHPPVVVAADEPASRVAVRMTEQDASAAIVGFADTPGIVTDADLRSRLVAKGAVTDIPVWQVATQPVVSVGPAATIAEPLETKTEPMQ